jgi:SAM-dependent methyltransferase
MFTAVPSCWVCECRALARYHECRFDFHEYAEQDPELAAYTGHTVWLVRCADCGFGQPERLPTLPRFFDRMYDQRWSPAWVEQEFEASYKDLIFSTILETLASRVNGGPRRLLDVGAHAGRFMWLARQAGWTVEGVELNPRTAACAARRTASPVHQVSARALPIEFRGRFTAITLTDVLEHIPEPVHLLRALAATAAPGGWLAVKVPCGPSQLLKERMLAAVFRGREVSLAGNLVHVNHFSPRSLGLALERAGFVNIRVEPGAPELLTADPPAFTTTASNFVRRLVFAAARCPGGVHTALTLNLQAWAQVPSQT